MPQAAPKAKRGAKGLPSGVIEVPVKMPEPHMKYQARLTWGSEHIEKKLRTLPDLHDTADEAAAALREAKRVLQADPNSGWITVWPDGLPGSKLRCARGTAPPRNKGVRKRKPAEMSPDNYGPLPTTAADVNHELMAAWMVPGPAAGEENEVPPQAVQLPPPVPVHPGLEG